MAKPPFNYGNIVLPSETTQRISDQLQQRAQFLQNQKLMTQQEAKNQKNREYTTGRRPSSNQGTVRTAKDQGAISKAYDVVMNPASAIKQYSELGYLPNYFANDPIALDFTNPARMVPAALSGVKAAFSPSTYADLARTVGYGALSLVGDQIPQSFEGAPSRTFHNIGSMASILPVARGLGSGARMLDETITAMPGYYMSKPVTAIRDLANKASNIPSFNIKRNLEDLERLKFHTPIATTAEENIINQINLAGKIVDDVKMPYDTKLLKLKELNLPDQVIDRLISTNNKLRWGENSPNILGVDAYSNYKANALPQTIESSVRQALASPSRMTLIDKLYKSNPRVQNFIDKYKQEAPDISDYVPQTDLPYETRELIKLSTAETNPLRQFMSAYNKIKTAEPNMPFYPSSSLSANSYEVSTGLLKKAIEDQLVNEIGFAGYNNMNPMGFPSRVGVPLDVIARNAALQTKALNEVLPAGKKMYYPAPVDYGQGYDYVAYPNFYIRTSGKNYVPPQQNIMAEPSVAPPTPGDYLPNPPQEISIDELPF